jgi:hypothetical protein
MKRLILATVLGLSLFGLAQTSAEAGNNRRPRSEPVRSVPEPSTALAAVAMLGFAWVLRKRAS